MKVVCIDNMNIISCLTVNKIYTTIKTWDNYHTITDDKGRKLSYLNSRFITIKDYRKAKLNKIYENR